MKVRSKLSIPRRVFIGFALVITVSGMVSVASFVQHQRTAATLLLLHEGFLPLALKVGEIRATQAAFDTLLDRVLFEHDTRATRNWFKRERLRRPEMMRKALFGISRVEELAPPSFAHTTIAELRRELKRVDTVINNVEERYDALFAALEKQDRQLAERILGDLSGHERLIARKLRHIEEIIQAQIASTSASASQQQSQSIGILAALIFISLVVGAVVTWWSQRMLSPLPLLQSRVEAVAHGDLVYQLGPTTDDEIGRLARQFEQMVAALAARDQSLRRATENLRSLQQMQEQILAGLRAAVLVIDGQRVIRSANPAAHHLLDISPEAIGKALSETDLIQRLGSLQNAILDVVNGEERAVLKAATLQVDPERKLDILVTPFGTEPPPGQLRSVLMVAEDVTEELYTKEQLIQTERLAAIGRMAAHVTHEVRSPLSSIGLNVEMLEDELPSANGEAKTLLKAIQREIESLTEITEEYLRVARLPNPRLEPEDLGILIQTTVQFLSREFESCGVEIAVNVEAFLPFVAVDESQIRQVLMNLLKNAREAMPEGGRVEVDVLREESSVIVRICDQGIGMNSEQREHVFDLFYTTKKYGTGLGLPLTKQIILAHGGGITCDSCLGKGTVFQIWLPVLQKETGVPRTPSKLPV